MPINIEENELLIRCSCFSTEHMAMLVFDPDTSRGNNLKGLDDDWYLSVWLDHFNFWKRLKLGVQYIFAPRSIKYGMSAELILKNEDMEKIASFIQQRI